MELNFSLHAGWVLAYFVLGFAGSVLRTKIMEDKVSWADVLRAVVIAFVVPLMLLVDLLLSWFEPGSWMHRKRW